MRRRRVLAALATVASIGLTGCGSDASPSTSTTTAGLTATSSPATPDCGEVSPRVRIENSLDRSLDVSLVVTERGGEAAISDRTVTVPPADDNRFSVTTVGDLVPESGWYTVEGSVGNRTASYDWRVSDPCSDLLAFQIGEEHFKFVPYGEG